MSGLLGIAIGSLNAFQRALEITGNNIANHGTPGYTRQSPLFSAVASQRSGALNFGNGVTIDHIIRNSDQFATRRVRDSSTALSQFDTFYNESLQLDKLLGQDGTSISKSFQSFFSAFSKLNDSPDSLSSRSVAMSQSELLVNQFSLIQSNIDSLKNTNNQQIRDSIAQINSIAQNIADINGQILVNPDASELLDKRDNLLQDLAKYTQVSVIPDGNNGVNVAIGNGQMLVIGSNVQTLEAQMDPTTQSATTIVIKSDAGGIPITESLHSGKLGAFIDYDKNILATSSQAIGQIAIGFAMKFNDQHKLGMDMNNQIGQNYFTDYNSAILQSNRASAFTTNTGTGVLSVAISDLSQLKVSDYELQVTDTGTNEIKITRKSDGQITTLNWTSTPPAPPAGQVVIDGVTIKVDDISKLTLNDTFTVTPTRDAARDLSLLIKDVKQIALASPTRTLKSSSNTGDGQIALGTTFNTAMANKNFNIQFISATQFNVINTTDSVTTGPFTFTPNTSNTVMIPDNTNPSYSLVISGTPQNGDIFTAEPNTGGFGNNQNNILLAQLQSQRIFDNATTSIFDRYSQLISDVASKTHLAGIRADASETLYKKALESQQTISGVSLEEEGGNLIKYQQAFQAAGQLVAVSNQIMNTLFEMLR